MPNFISIIMPETSVLDTTTLDITHLIVLCCIVLVASIIRGYAGFGFSAIVVAAASLFLPTREIVPLVLLLEITASMQMAKQVWRDIHWKIVMFIILGSLLLVPLGQYILLWVSIEPMRAIAAILVLFAVILLASGRLFPLPNKPRGWLIIGAISGFMNGLLAMGGMWAMIFLLGSGIKIAALRASLVALFFISDIYAAAVGSGQGLVTTNTLTLFLWSLPVLFLGIYLGSTKFEGSNDKTYKKVVLFILTGLAIILLIKVFITWFH